VLSIPAPFVRADQYSALAAGVGAFGVVVALGLAALSLYFDNRDGRVDRVLDMHAQYNDSDFREARRRLRQHLRVHGADAKFCRTTRADLRSDPELSTYGSLDGAASPREDAGRLFRYFERANAARLTGIVHEQLFHELIGRHAVWWAQVFRDNERGAPVDGLLDLAEWADSYPPSKLMYPDDWGKNRWRDFDMTNSGEAVPTTRDRNRG
jgi:hypothetical protein